MQEASRKTLWLVLVSFLFLIPAGIVLGQSGSRTLQSLINAERAFSKLSEEKGIKEAFLFYLADDSIVFRPKPVPGRTVYESAPEDSSALLTWEPTDGDVSRWGVLGYVFGTAKAGTDAPADPEASSGYLRIWGKTADGQWKIALDLAVPGPQE